MYAKSGSSTQVFTHVVSPQIGNAVTEAGYDLVKSELSAYRERFFESGPACFRSNISRYIYDPQYYFEVNDEYVKNKLKLILFPFLHKGHWMRATKLARGQLSYKPPVYDINAPDLYVPLMAFGTYLVVAGFFFGINGKFSSEAVGLQFTTALLCWLMQVLLLEATLHSLGAGDVPLLDVVAYGGYTFVAASVIVLSRIIWDYLFCLMTLWESFSMGMFLVKTMKRILIAEVKRMDHMHSTKRNYLLLFMAVSQIPLLFWLGSVCVKTT